MFDKLPLPLLVGAFTVAAWTAAHAVGLDAGPDDLYRVFARWF